MKIRISFIAWTCFCSVLLHLCHFVQNGDSQLLINVKNQVCVHVYCIVRRLNLMVFLTRKGFWSLRGCVSQFVLFDMLKKSEELLTYLKTLLVMHFLSTKAVEIRCYNFPCFLFCFVFREEMFFRKQLYQMLQRMWLHLNFRGQTGH